MKRYRIPETAHKYVNYDMINTYTDLPSYSEPRLRLLFAALNQSSKWQGRSELYTLVTALIQLGMDTHDWIDTDESAKSESNMRTRQLRVLAGDYYSARFYQLLASVGEVEMISKLSLAISEVNKLKLALYQKVQHTVISSEEYLLNRVLIKSQLFKYFHRLFEEPLTNYWQELLDGVTRFEVILEELKDQQFAGCYSKSYTHWSLLEKVTNEELQMMSNGLEEEWNNLSKKYKIREKLIDALLKAYSSVHQLLEQQGLKELKKELADLMNLMSDQLQAYRPGFEKVSLDC